jgi:hypothetical protein
MPDDLIQSAVDISNLKRISGTRFMPFFKYVLPLAMYAGVCAWMLSDESKKPRPDYPTLVVALAILGVIMVVAFKRRMWALSRSSPRRGRPPGDTSR